MAVEASWVVGEGLQTGDKTNGQQDHEIVSSYADGKSNQPDGDTPIGSANTLQCEMHDPLVDTHVRVIDETIAGVQTPTANEIPESSSTEVVKKKRETGLSRRRTRSKGMSEKNEERTPIVLVPGETEVVFPLMIPATSWTKKFEEWYENPE